MSQTSSGPGSGKTSTPRTRTSTRKPRTKSPAPARVAPLVGKAECVGVNRTEVADLVNHLSLGPLSALSPLGPLQAPGTGRAPTKVLSDAGLVDRDAFAWGLSAMARPDRVLDTRAGLYNSALTPCCLYSSRKVGPVLAGLRPGLHVDHELLSPFVPEDLQAWIYLHLQLSAGTPMALPDPEIEGRQLTFLFALVDAHKSAFAASLQKRAATAAPIVLSAADVIEADLRGRTEPDRRWLVRTMAELFAHLVRPGGRQGVALPLLDEAFVASEIRRYAARGYLEQLGTPRSRNPSFTLGPSLAMMAGSLFSWLSVVSLHDVQVTGWSGRPLADEALLVYIVTEPAVWTLVSGSLSSAQDTVGDIRFAFRALTVPEAERFGARFNAPVESLDLPDALYAPAAPAPDTAAEPAPKPPAAPPTATQPAATRPAATRSASGPPAPRPWRPSHRVPAGGLPAWERPDPALSPVAHLDQGLEVELLEETTGWGHILCSNGWSAWIDARYLEVI